MPFDLSLLAPTKYIEQQLKYIFTHNKPNRLIFKYPPPKYLAFAPFVFAKTFRDQLLLPQAGSFRHLPKRGSAGEEGSGKVKKRAASCRELPARAESLLHYCGNVSAK
jgi:hypothetical protein